MMPINVCCEGLKVFFGFLYTLNYSFTVTSGFRSESYNREVGGSPNSQHLTGEAVDFKPYGRTTYAQLLSFVLDNRDFLNFDQFIIYPTFFHISFNRTGNGKVNRVQVIDKRKSR